MASHNQKLPGCDHDLNLQGTPASAEAVIANGEKGGCLNSIETTEIPFVLTRSTVKREQTAPADTCTIHSSFAHQEDLLGAEDC